LRVVVFSIPYSKITPS